MVMRIDKAMLRKSLTRAGLPADKVKRLLELADKQEKAEQESLKKRDEDAEYRRQQQDAAKEEEPSVPDEPSEEGEGKPDPFLDPDDPDFDPDKIPTADEMPDISDEEIARVKEMDDITRPDEFEGFGDDLDKRIEADLDRMLDPNTSKEEVEEILAEDARLGEELVSELKRKLAEVDQDKV